MPGKKTLLDQIHSDFGLSGLQARTASSKRWFINRLKTMTGNDGMRRSFLTDPSLKKAPAPLPGRMFMFFYDPKNKKTLPYYDRFPLIFMVGKAPGGFYGINLHYLSLRDRARLFDALLDLASSNLYDEKTKLAMSYALLKGSAKYKLFAACFKHYLNDHIDSRITMVPPSEWEFALYMPTDDFVGEDRRTVWKLSAQS